MNSPNEKTLYLLTGPTAVGKTELALRWAETNGAEIVSCDSLLFYRGMDIGTAKPTPEERTRVPHHLIDVCEVNERMDITRYVDLVRAQLKELGARGKRVLVAGGSGFYLRSFLAPVADEVVVAPELRAEIEERLVTNGLASLVGDLRARDPDGIRDIDTQNPRRVVRALERCRATGKTLRELAADFSRQPLPFADWQVRLTRLDRTPEDLNQRIAARVNLMVRDGLIEEVKALLGRGLKENPSASRSIGYRETIEMLEGRLRPEDLASTIAQDTRGLVKKQRTWFRTQLPEHRVVDARTCTHEELFAESSG